MSGKMSQQGYRELIAENLTWLEEQPWTLEREHIETVILQRQTGDVARYIMAYQGSAVQGKSAYQQPYLKVQRPTGAVGATLLGQAGSEAKHILGAKRYHGSQAVEFPIQSLDHLADDYFCGMTFMDNQGNETRIFPFRINLGLTIK